MKWKKERTYHFIWVFAPVRVELKLLNDDVDDNETGPKNSEISKHVHV